MKIKEQSDEDRPRERLMQHGPSVLSPAELLAILVGSGSQGESAVELMQRILADHDGSLRELGRMNIHELTAYKGIGEAKAITIIAASELGKRRMLEEAREKKHIKSGIDIYQLLHHRIGDISHEESYAIYLRQDNSILGHPYLIGRGGISETTVDVRIVLREALQRGATTVAIAHNHPSGNIKPSREDDQLTDRLKRACQLMQLRLLDHVIITDTNYYSYHEQGKL